MTTETKRKLKAEKMRKYRIYKHILSIVKDNDAISLTFSFTDETLNKTNKETRLQYIKRYLNAFASDYVLNKDYGALNGREHYHAIATPKYKIFLCDAYKYGNMELTPIHRNKRYKTINKSDEETAKRFLNHALKETTKQSKIIFARKTNKESQYKKQIDAFLNRLNNEESKKDFDAFIYEEMTEIYESGKTAQEEETEEQPKSQIKHPKAFYFVYDKSMLFLPTNYISDAEIIYTASKYDIFTHQQQQRAIIYNEQSDIYKKFTNQIKNDNIVFTN